MWNGDANITENSSFTNCPARGDPQSDIFAFFKIILLYLLLRLQMRIRFFFLYGLHTETLAVGGTLLPHLVSCVGKQLKPVEDS